MDNEIRNIFISHIHEDDHRLQPLKDLLAKHGCDARDGSITSDKPNNATDPDYIKSQILAPQINWASTLVVLITPDTKDSAYVDWEIRYAAEQGKHIIGVWDRGEDGCELPPALEELADAVVAWSGEHIVDAILGDYTGNENCDGTPGSEREIARYRC